MIDRVNGTTVPGPFIGAFNSTDEIAIFTGHTPDYGVTVSMIDSDEGDDFVANVGEIVGNIYGRVYLGSEPTLDIKNVVYGEGASKYLISNGTLHVFNGLEKRLPMYDESTYIKSTGVAQSVSSKQFMRFKKATFVRHNDGRVGCFHVYDDVMEWVTADGEPFMLDTICGCFSQATGEGSNKPYDIYLVGDTTAPTRCTVSTSTTSRPRCNPSYTKPPLTCRPTWWERCATGSAPSARSMPSTPPAMPSTASTTTT